MKIIKTKGEKPSPKTIVFYNRELINAITEEEAKVENTTPSVIIENCILDKLFPKDELLQSILKDIYENKISVKQGMIDVFSNLSIYGEKKRCKKENKGLVDFLSTELKNEVPNLDNNPQFWGDYDFSYLYRNVEDITDYLEDKHCESSDMKFFCDLWKSQVKNVPTDSVHWYKVLFNIIINNWEDIYDLPSTYKVLMEICKTSKETAFDKTSMYELRNVLLSIEKHWC